MNKGAVVIPNIAGHSINENVEMCKILSDIEGISAVELNVSCPNVEQGGMAFGRDIYTFTDLVSKVRKVTKGVLIVKLSPNVTDITEFARRAKDLGVDAVSAINTVLGMKVDIKTRKPYFNRTFAGLSGPAIRPIAVRIVYEIFEKVDIPIIGLGGISCIDDVLEFIMAGASAVSIGTMNLVNPEVAQDCISAIAGYMKAEKIDNINELVGIAHR